MTLYRSGVVGVFINSEHKLLIAERSDVAGAWQFPQGGVEAGESYEQAVVREMREELGIESLTVLKASQELIRYDFPDHKKPFDDQYIGQEQKWFLLQTELEPTLENSDGEFSRWQWSFVPDILQLVVAWKKEAYIQGLSAIGLKL